MSKENIRSWKVKQRGQMRCRLSQSDQGVSWLPVASSVPHHWPRGGKVSAVPWVLWTPVCLSTNWQSNCSTQWRCTQSLQNHTIILSQYYNKTVNNNNIHVQVVYIFVHGLWCIRDMHVEKGFFKLLYVLWQCSRFTWPIQHEERD